MLIDMLEGVPQDEQLDELSVFTVRRIISSASFHSGDITPVSIGE